MPKIGRPPAEVVVTDESRAALVRLTNRARVNRHLAFRARIVLACIDTSDTAVARRLRTTKTTVAKWRGQFVERRLDGLYDEPRVGAPRTITDEHVEAIIVKTLEMSPPGEIVWSTRSTAKATRVSHTMVGRMWRTFRVPGGLSRTDLPKTTANRSYRQTATADAACGAEQSRARRRATWNLAIQS